MQGRGYVKKTTAINLSIVDDTEGESYTLVDPSNNCDWRDWMCLRLGSDNVRRELVCQDIHRLHGRGDTLCRGMDMVAAVHEVAENVPLPQADNMPQKSPASTSDA